MQGEGGLLDGKYEVVKRLASGGMGDVYLVRHHHLQELRVLKVLRPELAQDSAAARRFQQEARLATQIKHPNVAILYDYAQLPDGRYYMVWEYIEGQDVGTWLREQGPFPAAAAVELGIQVLRGLDAIHTAGVIHRDISPDNLLITRDRRGRHVIKIIDLGLAKNLSTKDGMEITQAGAFLGKLQYCSPEQAGYLKGATLDHRSDLYSFAQVLYEMVTGLSPFESESSHGFVLKRISEEPLPLGRRNPAVRPPVELERVVMQGLERDRERRFPDAPTFIRALVQVADQVRQAATQEIPSLTRERREATTKVRPPQRQAPREMSKEERADLLAQIESASRRAQQGTHVLGDAERALAEGRLDEARALLDKIEAAGGRPRGLAQLRARLHETERTVRWRGQITQAEQMLERYLQNHQQALAAMALETLLELYPNHPKRSDYESWVKLLGEEAVEVKRGEASAERAREALARGDLETARTLHAQLAAKAMSGSLADALSKEIAEAERSAEREGEVAGHRERLDGALAAGELERARQEMTALERLRIPRVTLDFYRRQLDEAAERLRLSAALEGYEQRYRGCLSKSDWQGARAVVVEVEKVAPRSERPAEMLAEISRLEEGDRREQSLNEGLRMLEQYLAAGDVPQAQLALRLLHQLAPRDPRVADAKQRLDALSA